MEIEVIKIQKEGKEMIVLRATQLCNVGRYILFDTTYEEDGAISNRYRHSYIFPNINLGTGDFVVLYSEKGTNRVFTNRGNTKTYELYWGLDVPVWNSKEDNALLVKIDEFRNFIV